MPADARRAREMADFAPKGLSIEEFLAFCETRPQEESWELIEGVPALNAAPVKWHQVIASNIIRHLENASEDRALGWVTLPGVGAIVPASPRSLPVPDVMVLPLPLKDPDRPVADDVLVLFEILSRSNRKKDQAWRRRVYASMPTCQHYVTVEQKKPSVVSYDRADDWKGRKLEGPDAVLALPGLGKGILLPLRMIYRRTPLM